MSEIKRYVAAGGVVVDGERVLVLRRPRLDEIRLPKGHVHPGETIRQAALREVSEESGYRSIRIAADLGRQLVRFTHKERNVIRRERFFLMTLVGPRGEPRGSGEPQFEPVWLPWEEALAALSFEAEREWVRRARRVAVQQRTADTAKS